MAVLMYKLYIPVYRANVKTWNEKHILKKFYCHFVANMQHNFSN